MTSFRQLLKQKGFTQTRLSQIADVSQSNLSIYSNYRETLEASSQITRLKLSRALEMTLEEFEDVLNLEPSKLAGSNKQMGNYKILEVE